MSTVEADAAKGGWWSKLFRWVEAMDGSLADDQTDRISRLEREVAELKRGVVTDGTVIRSE